MAKICKIRLLQFSMLLFLLLIFATHQTACIGLLDGGSKESTHQEAIQDSGDSEPSIVPDQVARPDLYQPTPDTSAPDPIVPDQAKPKEPPPIPDQIEPDRYTPPEIPDRTPPPDNYKPPKPCGEIVFRYDAQGQSVQTALVSGSFNNWADSQAKGAYAMQNTQGSIWETTQTIPEGTYEYKFIIDGNWFIDPNNPNKKPDPYGGHNSVLTIECASGGLEVSSHNTQVNDFTATVNYIPAASGVGLDSSNVSVTLNWQAVPSSAVSVSGNAININLRNLAKGIHDLRIQAYDKDGNATEQKLLKIYVGYSSDWRDVVLYFAMIDRFLDGDPNNNNPLPNAPSILNYKGGDFKGLSQKIDAGYFDELGVNAIWITWPIANPNREMPGKRFGNHKCHMGNNDVHWVDTHYTGYHGYWPADLDKVEPRFGTLQELQEMVLKAHKRGIRVLLDYTVNHIHIDSALYSQGKDKGYFNMPPEMCEDVGWDNKPITCWFVDYLPDINYNNADVSKIMLDHVVEWVKKTGADGLRIDALKHIEQSFIRQIRTRMTKEFEGTGVMFYMVGETFTGETNLINKYIGPDQVHGQFDFPLNLKILEAFALTSLGLNKFDSDARGIMNTYGDALMSTFIGNHDIARFISMASDEPGAKIHCKAWDVLSNRAQSWTDPPKTPSGAKPYNRLKLAFTYIFAIPGIPLIYYGDEFGLPGAGDPDNRRMMLFDSQLSQQQRDTLNFMKKLGQARQKHEVLRRGTLGPTLTSEQDLLVFSRISQNAKAVIVLNRSGQRNLTIPINQLNLTDGTTLSEAINGGDATVSGGNLSISIGGESAAIYITK
jgi:glycosidase